MKNKKRFQRLMLSATALLMIAPLTNQSQRVQAADTSHGQEPGLINTYGIAADAKTGKGSFTGSYGNKIGIVLRRNSYKGHKVNGTNNATYVHDHKLGGFLVANVKKSGKHKGDLVNDGVPFGPNGKKFKTSKEGSNLDTWVVYTKPKNAEAGKVGMYYKEALLWYPNSKKNKPVKPTKLDARIIWNGSWHPGQLGDHNNVQFAVASMGIKEPYQAAANFTLKLYKNGKPFAVKTQLMQKDIDHNQGLIFNTPSYLIYDQHTALDAGQVPC